MNRSPPPEAQRPRFQEHIRRCLTRPRDRGVEGRPPVPYTPPGCHCGPATTPKEKSALIRPPAHSALKLPCPRESPASRSDWGLTTTALLPKHNHNLHQRTNPQAFQRKQHARKTRLHAASCPRPVHLGLIASKHGMHNAATPDAGRHARSRLTLTKICLQMSMSSLLVLVNVRLSCSWIHHTRLPWKRTRSYLTQTTALTVETRGLVMFSRLSNNGETELCSRC